MAAVSVPIKGVRETGDTIFALSSGSVPSAVAVVRISGPRAGEALRALIGRLPEARRAVLARISAIPRLPSRSIKHLHYGFQAPRVRPGRIWPRCSSTVGVPFLQRFSQL